MSTLTVMAHEPPATSRNAARIGSVGYLNAKPLIYGMEDRVVLEHPARLAERLAAGEFDTGLVPVVEVFRRPGYVIVDGIAIACHGPVYSVLLAHRGPLRDIREVVVDAASGTSALLLRVLLEKRFGVRPNYVVQRLADARSDAGAQMLIGDQAIRFRAAVSPRDANHENHPGTGVTGLRSNWHILDLGQAWLDWTALPFVFAVWAVRADYPDLHGLAATLTAARDAGLANIEAIIARETEGDAVFRRRYFAENVRYSLGSREKEAMLLFQQHLIGLGELKQRHDLRFVS
jgi:predicted solute-binding protein